MKSLFAIVILFASAAAANACDAVGVFSQRACVQSYSAVVAAPVVQSYVAPVVQAQVYAAPIVQYQAVAPVVQYQVQQQAVVLKQKVVQPLQLKVRQRIIQRQPVLRQRAVVRQSLSY